MGLTIWVLAVLLLLISYFVYELAKEQTVVKPDFTGEGRWELYRKNSREKLFRKGLYLVFIAGAAVWLLFYNFTAEDWDLILIAASSVVFIDIAIFSTPKIKKIWNTEFDLEEIEKFQSNADDTVTRLTAKSAHFALVHENIPANLRLIDPTTETIDIVSEVILAYTSKFGLGSYIFEFYDETEPNHTSFNYKVYEDELIETLDTISSTFSLKFEDQDYLQEAYKKLIKEFETSNLPIHDTPTMHKLISNLLLDESYTLTLDSENKTFMLIPTFLHRRLYLILLVNQPGQIDTLDGSLVTQLVQSAIQNYECKLRSMSGDN